MALHEITEDGTLKWQCAMCQTHQVAQVPHPDVVWTSSNIVALPRCACGSQMFLNCVFSEDELTPPLILRNDDGSIKSVEHRGATNFHIIDHEVRRHVIPHPDRPGQTIEAFSLHITDVRPNPVIALHQKLYDLMHAHNKPAPQKAS